MRLDGTQVPAVDELMCRRVSTKLCHGREMTCLASHQLLSIMPQLGRSRRAVVSDMIRDY